MVIIISSEGIQENSFYAFRMEQRKKGATTDWVSLFSLRGQPLKLRDKFFCFSPSLVDWWWDGTWDRLHLMWMRHSFVHSFGATIFVQSNKCPLIESTTESASTTNCKKIDRVAAIYQRTEHTVPIISILHHHRRATETAFNLWP